MATIHQQIVNRILSLKPIERNCDIDTLNYGYEENQYDLETNKIYIDVCRDDMEDEKGNDISISFQTLVCIEDALEDLFIMGKRLDAYGSTLIGDELILNNYDLTIDDKNTSEDGFCMVLAFASVRNNKVRFSSIIYDFEKKELVLQEDFHIVLPFKVNLKEDFSGKRAVYRYDNIVSLRTTLEVYEKVDKKFHQSDECKNDLSYPRLILEIC
jgi:hypothetical protein